jgi:hypothetical protein
MVEAARRASREQRDAAHRVALLKSAHDVDEREAREDQRVADEVVDADQGTHHHDLDETRP